MEIIAKRRALGRGLGALIPGAFTEAQVDGESSSNLVPLSAIRPNPLQPRQQFSEEAIAELAESIRQKGILQPLLVRRAGTGYELIAGERRFRAAQRVGLEQVPVVVRDAKDGELLELALIENIQRENLNAIEEATAYRRLVDEFGLAQDEIAARVGKDRSTVANTIRLLQLPDEIKSEIERGELSAGHARALLNIDSESEKLSMARHVIAKRLSVRETERLAKRARFGAPVDVDRLAAEQRLTETFGTKVRIVPQRNGGGRIEIDYFSLEQLNGLIERLGS